MARSVTARQLQVLDFIQERISLRGYGPTVREIGEFLNIKSPNGVMCHLRALERKGMITRTANKSRSIELTDRQTRESNVGLPVHGQVAQGLCCLYKAPKTVDVISVIQRPDRYLLHYVGDDLREYAIADGDILIVEHASTSSHGMLTLIKQPGGAIELRTHTAEAKVVRWSGQTNGNADQRSLSDATDASVQDDSPQTTDKEATEVVDQTDACSQVIGIVVGIVRTHQPAMASYKPHFAMRSAVS